MSGLVVFLLNHLMWFWLFVMIACIVIEAMTLSLTTVWASISAFIMIFFSKTQMSFKWQLILFLILTIAFMVSTRPFVMTKLKLGKNVTNVNSLEGQEVIITKAVSKFEKGEGKTSNGVIWAVTASNDNNIEKDCICIIEKVTGNTLVVRKKLS